MYFKLALKNVKKSFKDFLIYFLTLAFSVCLFYTFNSFQAQQAVLDLTKTQSNLVVTLSAMMTFLSVFVSIVLAFLILYANNFLIKRRKKELGLYTLLGMPKNNISKILVYETFIIGLSSLATGMLAGIFLSQITTAFTASLFRVPLDYHFIFSPLATIITIVAFGGIFFMTMLFNTYVLKRYKLIDLINADRKNDDIKLKRTWLSILVFLLSLMFLGYSYYSANTKGIYAFDNIINICIAGIIGTFLFFLSLSGFLFSLMKHRKQIYLKNLNCFILRQIHSNVNSNYLSMGFVCIMLLLSIGALSTGMSLNHSLNMSLKDSAPYDYTYVNRYMTKTSYIENGALQAKFVPTEHLPSKSEELIKTLSFDRSYIKSENYVTTYLSDITYDNEIFLNTTNEVDRQLFLENGQMNILIVPLSSFNQELNARNYKPVKLKDNQIYMYSNYGVADDTVHRLLKRSPTLTIYDKQFQVMNHTFKSISIGTANTSNGTDLLNIVMKDEDIPENAQKAEFYWNVNHTANIDDEKFTELIGTSIDTINRKLPEAIYLQPVGAFYSKSDVYNNNRGLSIIMTYIGIYLGTVFLIASAVILALQQLSQASDNKKRYEILLKIGTDRDMINRSILSQLAIYFLLPLTLAVIHSYVGIRLVNEVVISFGKSDIFMSSIITAGIITCVYGSYFLVTYMSYKNIVKG